MAKKHQESVAVLDVPVQEKQAKKKSAAAILQACIAELENHQDAKLISLNNCAPRERVWYDAPSRDQSEYILRVVIKARV